MKRLQGLRGRELEEALSHVPEHLQALVRYYVTSYADDLAVRAVNVRRLKERLPWADRVEALKNRRGSDF